MALVFDRINEFYVRRFRDTIDPRLESFVLMGSPMNVVAISILYFVFVKYLGPKLMENRKAFELKTIMIVYNLAHIVINFLLGTMVLHFVLTYKDDIKCLGIDYSNNPMAVYEAKLFYAYYICKLLDLFDTVLFVLRKKFRQVTFLHVYHHIGMIFLTYFAAAYAAGGQGAVLLILNSYVHVLMYLYYLLMSIRPNKAVPLWWKKYLTIIQMVQFITLIIHSTLPWIQGNWCQYPFIWSVVAFGQSSILLVMFANFYYNSYYKKSKIRID